MAERRLDLGWMRVFEAVGRLGSLTAAAQELGLSQPAVSYVVRALESQLGARLLLRGHRGSTLSDAGLILHRAVAAAIGEIDASALALRRMNRRPVVRLFTDYGFASFWMMPRVAQFRRVRTDVEVHVVASAGMDLPADDAEDVAVLFGARSDFSADAVLLFEERVVPVCSPDFADRHGLMERPERMDRLPLLHLDSTPRPRWFTWADWFDARGLTRQPSSNDLSLNTYGLVVQAAIADQGLALGWSGLIDDAIAAGTLVPVGRWLARKEHGYWLHTRPAASEAAQDLASWITGEVQARAAVPRLARNGVM